MDPTKSFAGQNSRPVLMLEVLWSGDGKSLSISSDFCAVLIYPFQRKLLPAHTLRV